MPTRKIANEPKWPQAFCQHPEHNPPTLYAFEPGLWEHECPNCGKKTRFFVATPRWKI